MSTQSQKELHTARKKGLYRPKRKAFVPGSGRCRQRADNQNPNTDPTTEKDSFNTENDTAGQFPCLAGLHINGKHPCKTSKLLQGCVPQRVKKYRDYT